MNLRKSRMKLLRVALFGLVLVALISEPLHIANTSIVADILFHGLGLRLWAILYVGQRKSRELTITGPYSVCRNPLYVGTVLLTLGTCLSFENLVVCLFALAVVVPLHVVIVLAEEKHLREIFGVEYARYMQRTPRFWFRWSAYHSSPEVSVSIKVLRRTVFNAIGVLMIPPATLLVDTLRDHGILPVLLKWP